MFVPASPDTELQGTVKRASPWRVADPVMFPSWSLDATTGRPSCCVQLAASVGAAAAPPPHYTSNHLAKPPSVTDDGYT